MAVKKEPEVKETVEVIATPEKSYEKSRKGSRRNSKKSNESNR